MHCWRVWVRQVDHVARDYEPLAAQSYFNGKQADA